MKRDQVGINLHPYRDFKAMPDCRDLGIGWIRITINWSVIERGRRKPKAPNWGNISEALRLAHETNLQVYATVSGAPEWANGFADKPTKPTKKGEYFADFVEMSVRQFPGITHWGMWNEPNGANGMTRKEYLERILIPGAIRLHSIARETGNYLQVLGPDLEHTTASGRDGPWSKWLEDVLNSAGEHIDIITHHIYKDPRTQWVLLEGELWRELGGVFHKNKCIIPGVLQVLEKAGKERSAFWLTEIGWDAPNPNEEAEQVKCYKSFFAGIGKRTWIKHVFFYELHDDPDRKSGAKHEGLLRVNLSRKPAFDECRRHLIAAKTTASLCRRPVARRK